MTQQLTTTASDALSLAQSRPPVPGHRTGLDQHPAAVYLAGLAPGSRRTMRGALDTIAALVSNGQVGALGLDWPQLRFQHTAAIRASLANVYAPATVNKMLSALRGVLGVAYDLGQLTGDDHQRAVRVKGIKAETLPTGRGLTAGEIGAMFTACATDPSPAGVRDALILALLHTGLRRAEIARLELADFHQNGEGTGFVVRGKRRKERIVYLSNGGAAALADWRILRGDNPGPLLLQINKGGRIIAQGITAQAVYNVLAKRAEQAGVNEITPHDWRRTFAGDLLDAGVDLVTVQKLMGHANVNTTARYDRRPEAAKRQAVAQLHTPYQRRTLTARQG